MGSSNNSLARQNFVESALLAVIYEVNEVRVKSLKPHCKPPSQLPAKSSRITGVRSERAVGLLPVTLMFSTCLSPGEP